MNIEELKKRKTLLENDFKILNERIKIDTENLFRVQGAILNINDIIAEDEKKIKEEKEKEDKSDKKVK